MKKLYLYIIIALLLIVPCQAFAQKRGMCGPGPEIPIINWGACPSCYICDATLHMCVRPADCPDPQTNPNDPCCPPAFGDSCNPDTANGGVPCQTPHFSNGFPVFCDGLSNICKYELGSGWGCPQSNSECASGLYCDMSKPNSNFPGSCQDIRLKSCTDSDDCDYTYPAYYCGTKGPRKNKCTLGAEIGESCDDTLGPVCDFYATPPVRCVSNVCQ